ncbi:calcium-binding protein [Seohaeicola nanhaiensis]|uniref:Calcium-binding protein n=1 Tax=Seohaeicola nanhaiensis TaxID=1387282 RepID=A0ABV9KIW3_9RHOB
MAEINYYNGLNAFGYKDLYDLVYEDGRLTTSSATLVAGYIGGFYVALHGAYTYDPYGMIGGTLTGMTVTHAGYTVITVTGLNLDVEDVSYMYPAELEREMLATDDTLTSFWNIGDSYSMFGGDDWLNLGTGHDTVDGGYGIDTLHLDAAFASASFTWQSGYTTLITSSEGRDTVRSVEIIEFTDASIALRHGTSYSDTLRGDSIAEVPSDLIYGASGNDTIKGGTGDDRLFGQAGDDRLFGQGAWDLLFGGGGKDQLDGGFGNDRLRGGGGDDLLLGGRHADVLLGDGGSDRLLGGAGNDILTGGAGRDVFFFARNSGQDIVTDFQIGLDKIEIGRGAASLDDLTFTRKGTDVLITFEGTEILVENTLVNELRDADHFLF